MTGESSDFPVLTPQEVGKSLNKRLKERTVDPSKGVHKQSTWNECRKRPKHERIAMGGPVGRAPRKGKD